MVDRLTFADPDLAADCNAHHRVDQRWGPAGGDVRLALTVLAAAADLTVFRRLPNTRSQGDEILFQGATADVLLTIDPGHPGEIRILTLTSRVRAIRP